MSETEQPKQRWTPFGIPWGLRVALAISGLFGLGTAFLTTINHTFRESLYAGIGVFTISMAVTVGIWTIHRIAKDDRW